MRILLAVLISFSAWLSPALAQGAPAEELTFKVGSADRRAVLVNPAPVGQLRPVVIVLHGGRGSADTQRARTGFDDLAVAQGFSVVFGEGTQFQPGQHAWNTGYLMRGQVGGADDIGYLDTLIDLLVARHRADPTRIYMTGGSNGAMMTFVYAAKRADRLAAIAPIVGAMFTFDETPSVPLPILMINGGKDNEVPIAGGMSRNPIVAGAQAAPYKSLDETVSFWVAANRSHPTPVVETQGSVTTRTYGAQPGGAMTVSLVDAVGGHGWPGATSNREDNTPIQAFKGAERVWAFFMDKRRAAGAVGLGETQPEAQTSTQAQTPPAVRTPTGAGPGAAARPSRRDARPGARPQGAAALSQIDANQDGMISLPEWLGAGRREQGFTFMDANGDGQLTRTELQEGMARLQEMRAQRGGGQR